MEPSRSNLKSTGSQAPVVPIAARRDANADESEASQKDQKEQKPDVAEGPPARSRARVILPVLIGAAVAIGGGVYVFGLGKESTDDAQVEGRVIPIAARVQGQVARVLVEDNQAVKEGDVLVELDRRDYDARLASARADLASAKATLAVQEAQLALTERNVDSTMKQARGALVQAQAGTGNSTSTVVQARADLDSADSRAKLARIELDRVKKLFADGALAQSELDTRQSQFDQAVAAVSMAKARIDAAETNISSSGGQLTTAQGRLLAAETGPQQIAAARANVATAEAHVQQSQAALDLADLNVSYCSIKAPRAGIVSRRTVELGQNVSPERPLLSIVPPDDVWVVANFKEDQIAQMKVGQKVKVRIDTYGRRDFPAHVDSLAGASGARFALLPPDNASGNFVKVVQRIPVLVRFEGGADVPLRPGMSADVTVYTN